MTIQPDWWYNRDANYRIEMERGRDTRMSNLILFLNSFLSYLLLFVLIIALVIVACIIGVKWRKSKDAKLALSGGADVEQPNAGNGRA